MSLMACKPQAEHRPVVDIKVETFVVAPAIEKQSRTFNAQTVAAELTPLAFRLDGEISSVSVQEGERVIKGQTLATLDDSRLKQSLADAEARYRLASKQLKRGKELRGNNMISAAELDELSANYKLTTANLESAKARLKYTRLKAPFDGVISAVDKKKFENVTPGETVVSIYQDDKVYVKIEVSDSVLATLNPQNRSQDGYQPDVEFSGHGGDFQLSYLEHTSELSPETQTYEIWMAMPQVKPRVLPGTSARVLVDMAEAGLATYRGFQVPMQAIESGREPQEFYVWKLENNLAKRYPVAVDQINSRGAIVVSGIEAGDIIITTNQRRLKQDMELTGAAK
nr:efflux RND transporter periplasmic adaptor subunit [Vibrio maerlii]